MQLQTGKGERMANKREPLFFFLFILAFFTIQSAYTVVYAGNAALRSDTFLQVFIRLATWTLPVFVFLLTFETEPFGYLKLRKNIGKGLLWGVIVGAAIVLINIAASFAMKGGVTFQLNISADTWIKAILLVGFSEDVLFRGFILQKLAQIMNFSAANVLSAALFALVHIIGWLVLGQFAWPGILRSILYVFVFAVIQGIVLKKTGSLWACIVIHAFNNFISTALLL